MHPFICKFMLLYSQNNNYIKPIMITKSNSDTEQYEHNELMNSVLQKKISLCENIPSVQYYNPVIHASQFGPNVSTKAFHIESVI